MESASLIGDTAQIRALASVPAHAPKGWGAPESILGHHCGGAEMETALAALEGLGRQFVAGATGVDGRLAPLPGRDLARRLEAELGRVSAAAFDLDLLWRRYPDTGGSIDAVLDNLQQRRARLETALADFHRVALAALAADIRAAGTPPARADARVEGRMRAWLETLVDAALALDPEIWRDGSRDMRPQLYEWLDILDRQGGSPESDPARGERFVLAFLAGKRLDVMHRAGGEAGGRFARFAECRACLLGEYADYRYRTRRGAA